MPRLRSAFLVLVVFSTLSATVLASCKKEEAEPQTIPMTAPSNTPVLADPVPMEPVASAAQSAASAASAMTPPPATPTPAEPKTPATPAQGGGGGASIDACCKALAAVAKSGKSPESKAKAATGARICSGIDKLVKSGKTSRTAAMTQVKSSLLGTSVPAECN